MAQQGRRTGTIEQRGEKKWLVRIFVGRDAAGKRNYVSKTVTGTFKQAEMEKARMLRDSSEQELVAPSRLTVAAYLDRWLAAKTDTSARTRTHYERMLRSYVYSALGGTKLQDLSPLLMQSWVTGLTTHGLAPSTIRLTKTVFSMALEQAVEWGLLKKNPSTKLKLPSKKKTPPKVLTGPQMERLMREADTFGFRLGAMWTVLLTSGMRTEEVRALRWSDIDMEQGSISITRAITEDAEGREEVGPVKTESSARTITVPTETLGALKKHRRAQLEVIMANRSTYVDEGYVFTTKTGAFLPHLTVWREWTADLKRLGLPAMGVKHARHSHATLLLSNGVNPKVVQQRLGHANVQITLDTYSHVLPEIEQQTADLVGQVLFARKVG